MKLCVIVPAYNASSTLQKLLDSLLHYTTSILVVDDGSEDTTAAIAASFAAKGVALIRRSSNKGKGAALRTGMAWALEQGFDAAATMDSDLQHAPEDLPGLVAVFEKEKLDLLIGSRLHNQADMPKSRRIGNRFSSWAASYYCYQKIFDCQCGYRLYRLASYKKMFSELTLTRFDFESEVLLRASMNLLRIGFAPITVIYPKDTLHKSFYRPWLDTMRIIKLAGKELLRRLFTASGRNEIKNLKKYVKNCSDWPRYYQLPGAGQKNSLG